MRKLALVIACLWLVFGARDAVAIPIGSGQTFRIDFALTPSFPGPYDVAFFSPVFQGDVLGPFESLTFEFYDSADLLLAQRVFDIGNIALPNFGTGVLFNQQTSAATGHVLLTDLSGSINLVELTLTFMSMTGGGSTSSLTLTFPIPEPTSLVLFCAGLAGAMFCAATAGPSRRRRL